MSPEVIQASMLAVAACAQLGATVKVPALTLYDVVGGFHIASALRVALESNTVEILRENPAGLHANDISARNGVDPIKITRVLRLLATHHVFREVTPDVFANNRLSSMMDTLKSVDAIKADPVNKHVGTPGISALVEHSADEVFKGSAYLAEVLLDPKKSASEEPQDAPMMLAFKSSKPSWEWYEEPGNEYRLKRFAAAMEGSSKADPPNAIHLGFKWGELPESSVVVDVGGGLGHTTMNIAKEHKHLKFVVQDRPLVIEQAKEHWKEALPGAITNGTVELQAHDFFTSQVVKNASIFICRMVCHDYGKVKATQILSRLREAATSDTKLLLIEQVIPYACLDTNSGAAANMIPGAQQLEPPKPLLANLGKANAIACIGDFQMYTGLCGEERTIGTWIELTAGAGWRISRVFPIPGSLHSQILAVPI
ncbi:O-methyltransferase [Pleurotus eryngii]|uniref:O-methyltransferase n=1 Tax=Pleurotus eryngii TaxID=5323 RepID=A0A9P5ZYT0_PLEER|nr:O-methyltransferase [Pleurotus eryngii]